MGRGEIAAAQHDGLFIPAGGSRHRCQQWLDHKIAQMQSGMGQPQALVLEAQFLPEEEIEIQRARPPALLPGTVTPELSFDGMKLIQQCQGLLKARIAKIPRDQHHGIEIAGLIRRPPDGRGVQQGRPSAMGTIPGVGSCPGTDQRFQQRSHRQQGLVGASSRARQIGAEGNSQTGGGHPRVAISSQA
jgi:hypothetical protein